MCYLWEAAVKIFQDSKMNKLGLQDFREGATLWRELQIRPQARILKMDGQHCLKLESRKCLSHVMKTHCCILSQILCWMFVQILLPKNKRRISRHFRHQVFQTKSYLLQTTNQTNFAGLRVYVETASAVGVVYMLQLQRSPWNHTQ